MAHVAPGKVFVGLQITEALANRIDAFARSLEGHEPGREVTRSEAIRILITRGLDATAQDECRVPFQRTTP